MEAAQLGDWRYVRAGGASASIPTIVAETSARCFLGFFRCNRWVDQKEHEYYDNTPTEEDVLAARQENVVDPTVMSATYGTAMHEARVHSKKSREMARFLHHYERYNAHAESATLERKMSETVFSRLSPVVKAAIEVTGRYTFNFGDKGLSFVYAAFTELLECRSMLQHSYAFSYFRYQSQHFRRYKLTKRRISEKLAFEQLQSELEMMTEQMSDVVARSHLRATQSQITFLTASATEKRKEFSNLMIRILVSDRRDTQQDSMTAVETVENIRKSRKARTLPSLLERITSGVDTNSSSDGSRTPTIAISSHPRPDEDEEMEEAIRASLEEFMTGSNRSPAMIEVDSPEAIADNERLAGDWACAACTYVNISGIRCAMCGTRRS